MNVAWGEHFPTTEVHNKEWPRSLFVLDSREAYICSRKLQRRKPACIHVHQASNANEASLALPQGRWEGKKCTSWKYTSNTVIAAAIVKYAKGDREVPPQCGSINLLEQGDYGFPHHTEWRNVIVFPCNWSILLLLLDSYLKYTSNILNSCKGRAGPVVRVEWTKASGVRVQSEHSIYGGHHEEEDYHSDTTEWRRWRNQRVEGSVCWPGSNDRAGSGETAQCSKHHTENAITEQEQCSRTLSPPRTARGACTSVQCTVTTSVVPVPVTSTAHYASTVSVFHKPRVHWKSILTTSWDPLVTGNTPRVLSPSLTSLPQVKRAVATKVNGDQAVERAATDVLNLTPRIGRTATLITMTDRWSLAF